MRRLACIFALALVPILLYAGGKKEGSQDTTGADDTRQPVDLTFWQHSYPPLNDWTEAQIEAFTEENPNVDISFELIPFENYRQRMFTALATGQAPEVFETDDYTFLRFYENDALREISPNEFGFANMEAFRSAFRGNSLDLVTVNDRVYAIPYDWEAPVIGYNIEILEEHNVDPDELDTWPELGSAAQRMAERDENGVLTTAGMKFIYNIGEYYQHIGNNLFEQAGASILNEDGTASAINSPEAERVFQLWNDMIYEYRADEPGFTSSFYTEEFGSGRVAMGWMLTWANSILEPHGYEKGREFDLMPVPTFEGGSRQTVSNAWNWAINANISDRKAQAGIDFLRFKSDRGASFLEQAGLVSPRVGWQEDVPEEELSDYDEIFASLNRSRPHRPHVRYQRIWDPVIEVFQSVEETENPDIPALLEEAEAEINSILEQ